MKNKEKFAKEIFDIACSGDNIAITIENNEIVPCRTLECEDCIFDEVDSYDGCNCRIEEWCESEYGEEATLKKNERLYLDILKEKYKYIARDSNELIYVYIEMPDKNYNEGIWRSTDCFNYDKIPFSLNVNFNFIKWEDEKPWKIEDLKKLKVRE